MQAHKRNAPAQASKRTQNKGGNKMATKSITHAVAPQQAQALQAQASKQAQAQATQATQNALASASITAQAKAATVQNAIVQPNAAKPAYQLNPNYGKYYTTAQTSTGLTTFVIACNIAQSYGFSRWHFVKLAGKNAGSTQPACNLFNPIVVGRNKFVSATQAQLNTFYKCLVATGNLLQAISAMQPTTPTTK
jgi:hypothetical protein